MSRMERMALRLFGAWTELQSLMKDYTLMALEGDEALEYAERGKYPDEFILDQYKKIVQRVYGVAFPGVFRDIYYGSKRVRDKLAHLIDIVAIDGEQPHRVMTISYGKGFEQQQEGIWLQPRYSEEITEEELSYAISSAREAIKMLHIIYRLGAMFKEFQPSDDDVWDFHWVTWWDGRWGPAPTHPTEGYKAPVGRYRHHAGPQGERAYWNEDKRTWQRFNNDAAEDK
jgi:hypothetical protein